MADNIERLLRQAYAAVGRGDLGGLLGMLADNVHWRGPGSGPAAGDYYGKDGVLAFFGKMGAAYGHSFQLEAIDFLANDKRGVVLTQERAEYGAAPLEWRSVHHYEFEDGKCIRFESFESHSFHDFWRRKSD